MLVFDFYWKKLMIFRAKMRLLYFVNLLMVV